MVKPIQAIDLFWGAGGSTYGATNAGVNVVAGFDMWDLAIKAYKTNFPHVGFVESRQYGT